MASTLYSQLPLNTSNSEIRTLTVHPSDDHEAPINCSLSVASLNDNCDFEALSYVWHEPSLADVAPVAILVNGYEFTPTPNLFSALQHLRLPQTPRKLWVDAICINQDDLDERSAQVPLMTRIYTSAQAVAVWLGPSNSDIDQYARLEPQMAADIRLLEESFSRHFEGLSGPSEPSIITEMEKLWLEKAPKLLELVPGHSSLISNKYWSRMWTYQECCLPAASRVFYCGHNQLTLKQVGSDLMSFHNISLRVLFFDIMSQRTNSGGEPHLPDERMDCVDSLTGMGRYSYDTPPANGSSSLPAYHLVGFDTHLYNTKHRICKDPLDRFYALYGLFQDPSLRPPVDYTKDVRTVSAEIASYLISECADAWFFDRWDCRPPKALDVSSNNVWPSWVPDFRTSMSPVYIQYSQGVQASPRKKVPSISQDFSTITIQGKSFGPARILARFTSSAIDDVKLFAHGLWQTLPSLAAKPGLELSRERMERLITVLLFPGMHRTAALLRDTLVESLLNQHSESLNRLDETKSFAEDGRPNLHLPESSDSNEALWKYTIVGDQTEFEVMFVTDDLHLGFCNAQMRDGDIVARLDGQRGSCVLRRCERDSPRNPLNETVTMIGPSAVRHLPLIWNAETEDNATWFEDMTVDETEPVVFTIR